MTDPPKALALGITRHTSNTAHIRQPKDDQQNATCLLFVFAIILLHIPLLPEVLNRLFRALEHLRRRFGDEGAWQRFTRPDDEDFFAAFEGVLEFSFYSA